MLKLNTALLGIVELNKFKHIIDKNFTQDDNYLKGIEYKGHFPELADSIPYTGEFMKVARSITIVAKDINSCILLKARFGHEDFELSSLDDLYVLSDFKDILDIDTVRDKNVIIPVNYGKLMDYLDK